MIIKKRAYGFIIIPLLLCLSCVKNVTPKLPKATPQLVVMALLNNLSEPQIITLSKTKPFFDNALIEYASGAKVHIKDNLGNTYPFEETSVKGEYLWFSSNGEKLGGETPNRGNITHTLTVTWEEQTYTATVSLPKVPEIRSVASTTAGLEFVASDLPGRGNLYRVYATALNEQRVKIRVPHGTIVIDSDFANTLAQGFSSNKDGIAFSPRVRRIPSLERQIEIEIHAIPLDEALFTFDIILQKGRSPGTTSNQTAQGVAEVFSSLFSPPPSNVYSNIKNSDPNGKEAVGCFSIANVAQKTVP